MHTINHLTGHTTFRVITVFSSRPIDNPPSTKLKCYRSAYSLCTGWLPFVGPTTSLRALQAGFVTNNRDRSHLTVFFCEWKCVTRMSAQFADLPMPLLKGNETSPALTTESSTTNTSRSPNQSNHSNRTGEDVTVMFSPAFYQSCWRLVACYLWLCMACKSSQSRNAACANWSL